MNTAEKVRLNKEKHPERYCGHPRCLWSLVRGKACPKHPEYNRKTEVAR